MKSSRIIWAVLAVFLSLSTAFAQVNQPHSIYGAVPLTDLNYYNPKQLTQHNEFLAGTYDYPAKPRDMWEFGIKGGLFNIIGDVKPIIPTWGFGGHLRKALGHTVSLRLEYLYGTGKGQDWKPSVGYKYGGYANPWFYRYTKNSVLPEGTVWNPIEYSAVYYNYKTIVQELSLQILANIHNIRFYKDQTSMTLYAIGGVGLTTWRGRVDAMHEIRGDEESAAYDFSKIKYSFDRNDRKEILKQINNLINHEYDTPIERDPSSRYSHMFAGTIAPGVTGGFGLAFRVNPKINIAIEDKLTYNKSDLLDGQRWANDGSLTPDKDVYNYLTVGLNFNLGAKKKRVEPLYWLNPLNYAYSEIRNPNLMRIPPPVLIDSDGDGVIDQFDLEQTPPGCPVDTHGVSLDTDGDGVPDCRDKEKITPTYCQPVDADGVGKCPCPEGCAAAVPECSVLLGALPSVSFAPNSNVLSKDAQSALANAASRIRANPTCKVVVVGYCAATKRQQQLSWDHVNKVITYLVEKEGISGDRFIFSSGQEGGDCNTVDLRAAAPGEDGPNTVAPPHPNLRKK